MNNTRIIKFSLGLAIFLIILSSALSLFSLNKFMRQSRFSEELRIEIKTLFDMKYANRDAISKVRGYLLTGHVPFLEEYNNNRNRVLNNYNQLQKMMAGETEKLAQVEKIKNIIIKRFQVLDKDLAAYQAQNIQEIRANTVAGFAVTNAIDKEMNVLEEINEKELAHIKSVRQRYQKYTVIITVFSFLLSFVFIFIAVRAYQRANQDKEEAYAQLQIRNDELQDLNKNLDARVKTRTTELEEKNKELNLYSEHLKNNYEDLEVKVKFRTLELEKAIKQLQLENNLLKTQQNG